SFVVIVATTIACLVMIDAAMKDVAVKTHTVLLLVVECADGEMSAHDFQGES
ncbi:hypothetical protein A2U01_0084068, partial [Trifolium medium]|nr:hypothetical protein [Trifolium medium]